MPREIAHEWLLAETLAWPLVSTEGFRLQLTSLRRRYQGVFDKPTQRLADGLDEWLRPRAGGWSLASLRTLREATWFDTGEPSVSLGDYVVRHASRLLCFAGTRVALRPDPARSYQEQVNRWHWLCRALPPDLLIAACACGAGIEPMSEHVDVGSPDLARVLEREVAETHLHVGASVPFPVLWTGVMLEVAHLDPHDGDGKLSRGGPPPFDTPEAFVAKLAAAAVGRFLMAAFLHWRRHTGQQGSFADFWPWASERLGARTLWPSGAVAFRHTLSRILAGMMGASGTADTATIKAAYRHLLTLPAPALQSGTRDVAERDPIGWFLPARLPGVLPETLLAHHALGYLQGEGREDQLFGRMFWQYQRIRGLCFRHLTLEPGTEGLDWFGKHFYRIAALRKSVDSQVYRRALEGQSRGLRLASFEARTSPEAEWNQCWREIRSYATQARDWVRERPREQTEMGLVLHFTKKSRCQCGRLHADPRHAAFPARYGAWFAAARTEAHAIAALLEHAPESLLLLRGVDIANLELAIPTWVTVELFRLLRRESGKAARALARRWPGLEVEPLRVTCHAGEEFRRLGEGLRRIHELIASGILQRGDRIGHGLALGTCPRELGRTRRFALQPAEERLDDLLWEWERYARGDVRPPGGRETYVRAEIVRLARRIYRQGNAPTPWPTVEDLAEARGLRHDPLVLSLMGYPSCRAPNDPARILLWRYLTDADVFVRGQYAEEVELTELEVDALQCLQAWLRDQVAALAITVESNPTSNLLIGDMVDVATHPSFVLQPLGLGRQGTIPLSINTDNPLTFSTCLADEYAYLYAALLRSGASSSGEAIDWLDRARQAGWESRFTHRASADASCLDAVTRALDHGAR